MGIGIIYQVVVKKPFHRIDGKCCSQSHKNGIILISEKIALSLQTVGLATFLL